jgi:flagellar biosynthesis protein FlhG
MREDVLPRLMPDQAEGLRRLFVEDVRRMIALVPCGDLRQGGDLLAHLAAKLAGQGKRVLMLDESLSAGEQHGVFSVRPKYDLDGVLHEALEIEHVITGTPCRVDLIAGGGRAVTLSQPRMEARIGLVNAFYRLAGQYDVVLINTGSDSIQNRPSFAWACQDVIVLCHDHQDSATQAYAQIKTLHQAGERRFHLLFSGAGDAASQLLFRRVASVCRRHLQLMPACLGVLSAAGRLPEEVAGQILAWPLPEHQTGHFPALMRRLLHGSHARAFVAY